MIVSQKFCLNLQATDSSFTEEDRLKIVLLNRFSEGQNDILF